MMDLKNILECHAKNALQLIKFFEFFLMLCNQGFFILRKLVEKSLVKKNHTVCANLFCLNLTWIDFAGFWSLDNT